LFDQANAEPSLLADQQDERSGTYQQGNQNTNDKRNNPMPRLGRASIQRLFEPLRDPTKREVCPWRSAAFIGAALWQYGLRLRWTCPLGERQVPKSGMSALCQQ